MMPVRFQKIWKDLIIRKARTLLTLTGLVIGLWGICTVIVGNTILSHDLKANFTQTNPPDLILNVNGGPVDSRPVSKLTGVRRVESRPLLYGRIEISKDNWLPLYLFVVEDFQDLRVARFYPESDSFPPTRGTMLIERDGGELLIKVAQKRRANPQAGHAHAVWESAPVDSSSGSLQIQLPGGRRLFTDISGTVFDPGQAASRMELIIYGYVTWETAMAWMLEGSRNRLLVQVVPGEQGPERRRQLARRIEAVLDRAGVDVRGVRFPSPSNHPHQFQMNSILFLLADLAAWRY